MPAGDAHQLPEPVRGRGLGHLPQAEVDSLGEQHVEQTDAVAAGLPGSQVREGLVKASVNRVASSTSRRMSVIRVGHPPVEVGDQVSGPVRHGAFRPFNAEHAVFDAATSDRTGPRRGGQPAQALVQGDPALGEPVVRTGRDRRAVVGISDGGSRQQRLSDVAVAARPRQPDVAGAERVPQVEQHRRLPKPVIGLGAQQPAPLRIRPQEAVRPRRAVAAQDADRFQQGLGIGRLGRLGRGRRLDVQRAQHSRRVAPEADVLQVFVAQGVVAQQVRLALRKGKQGRPLPAGQDGSPCHSLSLEPLAKSVFGRVFA